MPTTATHTAARAASLRSSGLEICVGLEPIGRSGSFSATASPMRLGLPPDFGAQTGPRAAWTQGLPPAQWVPPVFGTVQREGDEFGAPADVCQRNRPAEAVAVRAGVETAVRGMIAI